MKERLKRLRKTFRKNKISALFVSDLSNIKYLSGFSGTAAFLLVTPTKAILFTDSRYFERCKTEVSKYFSLQIITTTVTAPLESHLKKERIKNLGVEVLSLSHHQFSTLKKDLSCCKLISTVNIIEQLRQIKDKNEILKLKKAINLNDQAFSFMKKTLFKKQLTASELSLSSEIYIKKKGAQGFAFNPIITFGKDSASPHALLTKRPLRDNDSILIDFGTQLDEYHSDLTRVYFKKKYHGKLKEIYKIVLEAQQKAIAAIKPGITASLIDKIARDYIKSYGYEKYFGHSLGHGIGLQVHELPAISSRSKQILEPGMVFSIEPGIYLPGTGGVRIEDLIMVTEKGCQTLSKTQK